MDVGIAKIQCLITESEWKTHINHSDIERKLKTDRHGICKYIVRTL